jgi:2-oxoglutarate dehydrogenase complex dehydrogenase (E1) component-like enzyme
VRIEQIAPLHYSSLVTILQKYKNATQFVWFQEEHRNSGAWGYVSPRISVVLEWLHKNKKVNSSLLECVSRKTSASTAVGKKKKHDDEQI